MQISAALHRKIVSYQPAPAVAEVLQHAKVLLLVGITGAGKDTVMHQLLQRFPDQYHHIVSHTTRQPRANKGVMERTGMDYHFMSLAEAEGLVDKKAFIEVKEFGNNVYGTSINEVRVATQGHKIAVTAIEVQGADEYVKLVPAMHPVFILPPSYEVWQERTRQRYGGRLDHAVDNLAARLKRAAEELRFALDAGYFHFVVNGDLEDTVAEVHRLALSNGQPSLAETKNAHRVIGEIVGRLE